MAKILVIDDDFEILKLIKNILVLQGHYVVTLQDVRIPFSVDEFTRYDLILLDIMLGNTDGFTICQRIRSKISTPILFISAKDTEEDIIKGLTIGGDDYITKPFSLKQLVAKVESHLKRQERIKSFYQESKDETRYFQHITILPLAKKIYISEQEIPFTAREFRLIEVLSQYPKKVFSQAEIHEKIYDKESDTLFGSVAEYVYQIRRKCSTYGINPIKTVRGIGYQWND